MSDFDVSPGGILISCVPPPAIQPPEPPPVVGQSCDLCGERIPGTIHEPPFGNCSADVHRWVCRHPTTYTCRPCADDRWKRRCNGEDVTGLYPGCPVCGCNGEYT